MGGHRQVAQPREGGPFSACHGSKPVMWFTRLRHQYCDSQFEAPAGEPGATRLLAEHPLNNSTQDGGKALEKMLNINALPRQLNVAPHIRNKGLRCVLRDIQR